MNIWELEYNERIKEYQDKTIEMVNGHFNNIVAEWITEVMELDRNGKLDLDNVFNMLNDKKYQLSKNDFKEVLIMNI